jgi:excisionase family DNA binding protein
MALKEDTAVLTTRQAAQLLGLSLTSVQKMAISGELDAWITPGGHRRIHRESIDRLLHSRNTPRAAVIKPDCMRILLVEDDALQVRFFQSILERCTYRVELTIAGDGSTALILLERTRPDLVVTDLLMQPFDGFHLIAAMDREPAYYPIDTIVCSSMSKAEAAALGNIPNSVTYFQKPISPDRLLGYLDAMQTRVIKLRPAINEASHPSNFDIPLSKDV